MWSFLECENGISPRMYKDSPFCTFASRSIVLHLSEVVARAPVRLTFEYGYHDLDWLVGIMFF